MSNGADTRREGQSQSKWVWFVPLGFIALLVLMYFIWPSFHDLVDKAYSVLSSGEQERIEEWIDGFGAWSFVVIVALMLFQTLVPFLPSIVTMVVAVVSFGPIIGGIVAWGGMLLAASLGYVMGRALGVAAIDRLVGEKTEKKMQETIERYGVWAIIAARVSPALSTDAISIAAGLVKMSYIPFIAATAAGTLPLTVLIAWLGEDFTRLTSGLIWISAVSVAIFVGYVVYDRYFRSK